MLVGVSGTELTSTGLGSDGGASPPDTGAAAAAASTGLFRIDAAGPTPNSPGMVGLGGSAGASRLAMLGSLAPFSLPSGFGSDVTAGLGGSGARASRAGSKGDLVSVAPSGFLMASEPNGGSVADPMGTGAADGVVRGACAVGGSSRGLSTAAAGREAMNGTGAESIV